MHLRTPAAGAYNHNNSLRIESHGEARAIDSLIDDASAGHPRYFDVPAPDVLLGKAAHVLSHQSELMPDCCRGQVRSLSSM